MPQVGVLRFSQVEVKFLVHGFQVARETQLLKNSPEQKSVAMLATI